MGGEGGLMSSRTPLMQQYHRIKSKYPDSILLFRMGDFYETFYSDAKDVSKVLGITLTARNYKDETIPMAGFPVKSADMYIVKLVKAGMKLAVCEQLEEPKKGSKLVKRGVVEVLTPGTVMRQSLLKDKKNNYIASFASDNDDHAAALSDISTGEFRVILFPDNAQMMDYLDKAQISEILVSENNRKIEGNNIRYLPDYYFSQGESERILKNHFNVTSLRGLGFDRDASVMAAGTLLQYIAENQKDSLEQIRQLRFEDTGDSMYIDRQTLRNLEIFRRNTGEYENSFLSVIDHTCTPMGGRKLRERMIHPFLKKEQIAEHLSDVELFFKNPGIIDSIMGILRDMGDIERISTRIVTRKAGFRDVIMLSDALKLIPLLKRELSSAGFKKHNDELRELSEVIELTDAALDREKILSGSKEQVIKEGYSQEYDELSGISVNTASRIRDMEEKERKETGINTLKIGYNSIAGYYIEVTKANNDKVPVHYKWKQTLKNSQRYTTPQLKEYENSILHANDRLGKLEKELFIGVLDSIARYYDDIKAVSLTVALIDLIVTFAHTALAFDYRRPEITDGRDIRIENGRHPVVEQVAMTGKFIPNNLKMDKETQIILLTGPNMSGKSTYLRQNALIIYMAHLGMFVPADTARIPVTDRIFTRIGASDDISSGVSTFMAEMLESANIINNMTDRSFIILDEIGRGTSTFDGLSIAWAIVEYLHESERRPNTLFATHYHELTELEVKLERMKNYTTKIRKSEHSIVYLKKIVQGKSDESYGIEVAKMAGFPDSIINNGYTILTLLKENEDNIRDKIRDMEQLRLFSGMEKKASVNHPVLQDIRETDIDNLTPLEALLMLSRMKKQLDKEE